jgi:hypothetical protein
MIFRNENAKHLASLLVFAFLLALAAGSADRERDDTTTSSPSSVSSAQETTEWFQGGNLHNSSVADWKVATRQNKLATAADWLTATKWKGHLTSPQDFDRLKLKAETLVNAVDEAVAGQNVDHLEVREIAAALLTMSNDLGP